jgi:hypothetical protein
MLDMHTPLSLNLRQWFSIGVVTYSMGRLIALLGGKAGRNDLNMLHVVTRPCRNGWRVARG